MSAHLRFVSQGFGRSSRCEGGMDIGSFCLLIVSDMPFNLFFQPFGTEFDRGCLHFYHGIFNLS